MSQVMKQSKFVISLVLLGLLAVFAIQNTEEVELTFFALDVSITSRGCHWCESCRRTDHRMVAWPFPPVSQILFDLTSHDSERFLMPIMTSKAGAGAFCEAWHHLQGLGKCKVCI